jgi:hypothetical protein
VQAIGGEPIQVNHAVAAQDKGPQNSHFPGHKALAEILIGTCNDDFFPDQLTSAGETRQAVIGLESVLSKDGCQIGHGHRTFRQIGAQSFGILFSLGLIGRENVMPKAPSIKASDNVPGMQSIDQAVHATTDGIKHTLSALGVPEAMNPVGGVDSEDHGLKEA